MDLMRKPYQDGAQPAAGDLLLQRLPQRQWRVRVVDLRVAAVVQDAQALQGLRLRLCACCIIQGGAGMPWLPQ